MCENGNIKKELEIIRNLFNSETVSGLLRSITVSLYATSKVTKLHYFPSAKKQFSHLDLKHICTET